MTHYFENFDLLTLVREFAATARPLINKNRNQLVVECAEGLGGRHADQTKIRQTHFNLLSNARSLPRRARLFLESPR